jgi:hypothetical protein
MMVTFCVIAVAIILGIYSIGFYKIIGENVNIKVLGSGCQTVKLEARAHQVVDQMGVDMNCKALDSRHHGIQFVASTPGLVIREGSSYGVINPMPITTFVANALEPSKLQQGVAN